MRSVVTIVLLSLCCSGCQKQTAPSTVARHTFTNPLLPSGPDPWSIYKDGFYYYTNTLGNQLAIWKTKSLANLKNAEKKVIWNAVKGSNYSSGIWAPELHFIENKWYMYFAADNGKNENHRLYVLENASEDPMQGEWIFKGKISDPTDKWAIDGTVFMHKGQRYFAWSGWEGNVNKSQNIYLARMKNPWTIEGKRVMLSRPQLDWETHGDLNDPENPPHVDVNEGPQFLSHGDTVFIIYSASGCWTDYYALGMLSASATSDLMDSTAWTKSQAPVFTQSPENGVYAPGHNSFFKSPDGREDWILYHANSEPGQGCGEHRSPRAQKFKWNANGLPEFGVPQKAGVLMEVPSNRKH
jgi:GH43 family beta-xylosidase